MAMKNAADVAKKWARNLAASTDSIRAGVQGTTTNPAEKAAARADAYLQGVQRAHAEGKYQRGLRRVTLQSWQEAMLNKGLTRVATGASGATSKVQNFHDKWLPHMEALKAKLANMPRGDIQSNIQRAVMTMEHNASFKHTG